MFAINKLVNPHLRQIHPHFGKSAGGPKVAISRHILEHAPPPEDVRMGPYFAQLTAYKKFAPIEGIRPGDRRIPNGVLGLAWPLRFSCPPTGGLCKSWRRLVGHETRESEARRGWLRSRSKQGWICRRARNCRATSGALTPGANLCLPIALRRCRSPFRVRPLTARVRHPIGK